MLAAAHAGILADAGLFHFVSSTVDRPFYAELGDESASFSSDGHVDYSAGKLGDENASFSTDGHVDYPAGQLGNANVSFD